MQHIDHNLKAIRRRIMLRVWYSYFLSLFIRGSFFYGLLLGGVVSGFGRLTHVSAIINNLLDVPLGMVPNYIWQTIMSAVASGEILTVLVSLCLFSMLIGVLLGLKNLSESTLRLA